MSFDLSANGMRTACMPFDKLRANGERHFVYTSQCWPVSAARLALTIWK